MSKKYMYIYIIYIYMEVSINCGTPKWLVHEGKPHLEMDDDWGYPYFRKPPYVYIYVVSAIYIYICGGMI